MQAFPRRRFAKCEKIAKSHYLSHEKCKERLRAWEFSDSLRHINPRKWHRAVKQITGKSIHNSIKISHPDGTYTTADEVNQYFTRIWTSFPSPTQAQKSEILDSCADEGESKLFSLSRRTSTQTDSRIHTFHCKTTVSADKPLLSYRDLSSCLEESLR